MRYVIKKPSNTNEWPVWIDPMDKFDGEIIDKEINVRDGNFHYKGYNFSYRWVVPLKNIKLLRKYRK